MRVFNLDGWRNLILRESLLMCELSVIVGLYNANLIVQKKIMQI